jgi:hypothetical protein
MELRVKKLIFPIVMAIVGILAIGVVAQNYVSKSSTAIKSLTVTYTEGVTGEAHKPGDTITLPTGINQVFLKLKLDDENASYTIKGDKDFVAGNNTLTINVEGADGKSNKDYTLTLIKPKLSGWCEENAETVRLYNDDYDSADIYGDISLAYLDERLPVIQANLSCFSDGLQKYINEHY